MPIITLTTDFGTKDHFVGAIKGAIYSEIDSVSIVDISHRISPFNIQECAYVLKNAYKHFPKGSIHLVGVDTEHTDNNEHIVVYVDGHYFISANNGVISLISNEIKPDKVFSIQLPNTQSGSFPELEIFAKVACHIARGGTLDVIGKPYKNLTERLEFKARISDDGNSIIGNVIYIDNYGNVVTNIQKHLFDAYRKGRAFKIEARHKIIRKIHNTYSEAKPSLSKNKYDLGGDLLAIFNADGYIELAIYKSDFQSGGAASLLGLDYRDSITIEFE